MIGSVALIGVNSAVPTPPAMAWGCGRRAAAARLPACSTRARDAGLFRLVMIHHPPLPGQASPARALKDAEALQTFWRSTAPNW